MIILSLYILFNKENNKIIIINKHLKLKMNTIIIVFICTMSILLCFNLKSFVSVLKFIGLNDYTYYINGDFHFLITKLIVRIPFIVLFLTSHKSFLQNEQQASFYIILAIMEILILNFSTISVYSIRIGYLFQFFYIISVPLLCCSSENKKVKYSSILLLLGYLIFYWCYYYGYLGIDETVPYIFN